MLVSKCLISICNYVNTYVADWCTHHLVDVVIADVFVILSALIGYMQYFPPPKVFILLISFAAVFCTCVPHFTVLLFVVIYPVGLFSIKI